MFKKILVSAILGSTLIATGCQTMTSNQVSKAEKNNLALLQDRTWVATQINSTAIDQNQSLPSLKFDSATKHVSGTDSCNQLMGSYTATDSSLKFGNLASTRRLCMDNNNLDLSFNSALNQVKSYKVTEKKLQLLNQNGQPVLEFNPMIQPR